MQQSWPSKPKRSRERAEPAQPMLAPSRALEHPRTARRLIGPTGQHGDPLSQGRRLTLLFSPSLQLEPCQTQTAPSPPPLPFPSNIHLQRSLDQPNALHQPTNPFPSPSPSLTWSRRHSHTQRLYFLLFTQPNPRYSKLSPTEPTSRCQASSRRPEFWASWPTKSPSSRFSLSRRSTMTSTPCGPRWPDH